MPEDTPTGARPSGAATEPCSAPDASRAKRHPSREHRLRMIPSRSSSRSPVMQPISSEPKTAPQTPSRLRAAEPNPLTNPCCEPLRRDRTPRYNPPTSAPSYGRAAYSVKRRLWAERLAKARTCSGAASWRSQSAPRLGDVLSSLSSTMTNSPPGWVVPLICMSTLWTPG